MSSFRIRSQRSLLLVLSAGLLLASFNRPAAGCCFHKKYETPITKVTQQPDKVLFDQAIKDIEHGRYETARISLQTMMNTYESSEYMAKAKLAVADSWYREGGANGLAQAEAEYKDFQLFYPQMEEAAEAQNRICEIHYKQMDKSDRDWTQTVQAESECRTLIVQYPNSKFVPQASQRLREIQESLAEHEFVTGNFYWRRDKNPAAANRLSAVVDQYPLFSKAGEALYEAGDAYSKMGPRFRKNSAEMFDRIVQEYPLSNRADDAKKRLAEMEMAIPPVDKAAEARERYDLENYHHPSMVGRAMGLMHSGPDVSHAAKAGPPTMSEPKRTIPVSVPVVNNTDATGGAGTGSGSTELTATTVGANSALDKNPDARSAGGQNANSAAPTKAADQAASTQPLPTNRDAELKKYREQQAKKQAKLEKKKKKESGSDSTHSSQGNGSPGAQTSPGASSPPSPPVTSNAVTGNGGNTGSNPPR